MPNKYDKILGQYREKDSGSIPQVDGDPVSPKAEDVWVLKTQTAGMGGGVIQAFIGMGLPMLSVGVGSALSYELSFRTKEGSTKRVTLS